MGINIDNSLNKNHGDERYLKLDCSNDPLTGNLDVIGSGTFSGQIKGLELYSANSGTITRTSGYVSSVAVTGGRTLTITRNGTTGLISSVTDGTNTWTLTRDGDNRVTSWALT